MLSQILPSAALTDAKLLLRRPDLSPHRRLHIVEYAGTPAARAFIWQYEISCSYRRDVILLTTSDVFRQDAALLAELPLSCAVFLGTEARQLDSVALRRLHTQQRVIAPSGRPLFHVKELRALVEVCAPQDGLQDLMAALCSLERDDQLERLQQMLSAHLVPANVASTLEVGGLCFACHLLLC